MHLRRLSLSLLALLLHLPGALAQGNGASPETRTAHAFETARKQGPLALREFLVDMPKGADLHVHFGGAIYAETFLRDAAQDGLCIDSVALRVVGPPCTAPLLPASEVNNNLTPAHQDLYDRLIDAFSMRSFVPTTGFSGHDQFFATFSRFGPIGKEHDGEWIDEIVSRAAAQNQQYVEIMETPQFSHGAQLAREIGWNPDLAQLRQALLDRGLRDEVAIDRKDAQDALQARNQIEHCGSAQQAAACQVQVRFIYQILRGFAPERVFAQTLLGFETIHQNIEQHGNDFVGINFVMPEDGFVSMRDYSLQMHMVEYLHSVYPNVHISLHAGELAPGLVPPEGLRFHIRQAVEIAHAERIGHGVDALYEDNAPALLKEMAAQHVMVEINLTSNDGILGIKGADHPLPYYRKAGVPVALSTDDEGVSRIDLTHEYVRAALDFPLTYADLKQMARTGMEHNFLPGKSLWAKADEFTLPAAECRNQPLGSDKPSSTCQSFLTANEKAAAQWEQERRFRTFESKW